MCKCFTRQHPCQCHTRQDPTRPSATLQHLLTIMHCGVECSEGLIISSSLYPGALSKRAWSRIKLNCHAQTESNLSQTLCLWQKVHDSFISFITVAPGSFWNSDQQLKGGRTVSLLIFSRPGSVLLLKHGNIPRVSNVTLTLLPFGESACWRRKKAVDCTVSRREEGH